jgi:hypothetical protein
MTKFSAIRVPIPLIVHLKHTRLTFSFAYINFSEQIKRGYISTHCCLDNWYSPLHPRTMRQRLFHLMEWLLCRLQRGIEKLIFQWYMITITKWNTHAKKAILLWTIILETWRPFLVLKFPRTSSAHFLKLYYRCMESCPGHLSYRMFRLAKITCLLLHVNVTVCFFEAC